MKRFLRGCALLVLLVVLVAALSYLMRGLHGAAQVSAAKGRAAADLAQALPASERAAARDQRRAIAGVTQLGRPAYSWRELRCELDTEDVGWIVDHYVQECRIDSVALIPTTTAEPGECEYVLQLGEAGNPTPPGVRVYRATSTTLADDDPQTYCPDGIAAPPHLGVSRLLDGHRPAGLDTSPAWYVVVTDTAVSYSELGCDPWAVVFCTAPVDRPVLGDAAKQSS